MSQSDRRQQQRDGRSLCRYFASNMCNKGEQCEFSHDRNAKADMVCRYYLAGNCTYGSQCRYDHVRPNVLQSQRAIAAASTSIEGASRRVGEESTSASTSSSSWRPPLPQEKPPIPLVQSTIMRAEVMPLIPSNQLTTTAWSKPLEHATPSPSVFDDFSAVSGELARIDGKMEQNLADVPLCPYFEMGYCINAEGCPFIHGMACSMCDRNALHPFNEQQRLQHHRECLAEHEALMEKAFAEARSVDKQCGICFEMIFEKSLRFGILQNCKHCYCLPCIRKWRQQNTEQAMENNIVRSCPECRVHSNFVVPSSTWTEDEEEKKKMISDYQANMKTKVCKYMSAGRVDDCPFGNRCFYKHQLPSGEVIEGDAPHEIRRQKRYQINLHQLAFGNDNDQASEDIMQEVVRRMVNDVRDNNNPSPS